jgi:hypothetical protein
MAAPQHTAAHDPAVLRQDLATEYYAILNVVTDFDQRLMIVKGWSVTLSLASLGLGFQQGHYALFGLASATAIAFWYMDAMIKGHQLRYYSRMRDIEVATHALNSVDLDDLGTVSAPRIDMYWSFKGYTDRQVNGTKRKQNNRLPRDWRSDAPERRTPQNVRRLLRRRFWASHVLLPHIVAAVLGLALFAGALANLPGLEQLDP